jgi:hypothetical protein
MLAANKDIPRPSASHTLYIPAPHMPHNIMFLDAQPHHSERKQHLQGSIACLLLPFQMVLANANHQIIRETPPDALLRSYGHTCHNTLSDQTSSSQAPASYLKAHRTLETTSIDFTREQ